MRGILGPSEVDKRVVARYNPLTHHGRRNPSSRCATTGGGSTLPLRAQPPHSSAAARVSGSGLATFSEAAERLEEHLLLGETLRDERGAWNGVVMADFDADGFVDVAIANEKKRVTRHWSPEKKAWVDGSFPIALVGRRADGHRVETGARFGVVTPAGDASLLIRNDVTSGTWTFDGSTWKSDPTLLAGLEIDGAPVLTMRHGVDLGVRLRDVDGDGICEVLVSNPSQNAVFQRDVDANVSERPRARPPMNQSRASYTQA